MVGLSLVQVPLYFPMIAEEKGVEIVYIGFLLAIRPIFGLIVAQYCRGLVLSFGIERTIFYCCVVYSLSNVGMAFEDMIDNKSMFIIASVILLFFQGISFAGMTIGE